MTKVEAVRRMVTMCGLAPISSLDTGGTTAQGLAERTLDDCEMEIQSKGWHYNVRSNQTLSPSLYSFANASWTFATLRLTGASAGVFADATIGQTLNITVGATTGERVVTGIDTTNGNYVTLDADIGSGGNIASGIGGVAVNNKISAPAGTLWLDNDESLESRDIAQVGGRLLDKTSGINEDLFTDSVICKVCYRYTFDCIQPVQIRKYIAATAAVRFLSDFGPRVMSSDAYAARLRNAEAEFRAAKSACMRIENEKSDVNVNLSMDVLGAKGWRGPSGYAGGFYLDAPVVVG